MYSVTCINLSRALLPSRAVGAKQEQVKRTMGISLKKMIKTKQLYSLVHNFGMKVVIVVR